MAAFLLFANQIRSDAHDNEELGCGISSHDQNSGFGKSMIEFAQGYDPV